MTLSSALFLGVMVVYGACTLGCWGRMRQVEEAEASSIGDTWGFATIGFLLVQFGYFIWQTPPWVAAIPLLFVYAEIVVMDSGMRRRRALREWLQSDRDPSPPDRPE